MPATTATQLTIDLGDVAYELPDSPASLTRQPAWRTVDLGPFDGPTGAFAGSRPVPSRYGLTDDTPLAGYAQRLYAGGLTVRTSRQLHRDAVLSALRFDDRREILRAAATWTLTLLQVACEQTGADGLAGLPATYRTHVDTALTAVFELGATRLCGAGASRWLHPGTSTEGDDLFQVAQIAMVEAIAMYDPDQGVLSAYAERRIRDKVSEHVRATEHPGMPRAAFKRRGEIRQTATRIARELADEDAPPLTFEQMVDALRDEFDDVSVAGIRRVLAGTSDVSLDAAVSDSDGTTTYLDMMPDLSVQTPEEICMSREVIERALTAAGDRLDPEERELVLAHFGFLTDEPVTLRDLGASVGRSRAWAGAKVHKALSKLAHPIVLGDLVDCDAFPSDLSNVRPDQPLVDLGWMGNLTERQRYVAGLFFGFGRPPLPGSPQERRDKIAEMFDVAGWVVDRLIAQVQAVRAGADIVPAVYPDWYPTLPHRHRVALKVVFRFGLPPAPTTLQQRIAELADTLKVGYATAEALARTAGKHLAADPDRDHIASVRPLAPSSDTVNTVADAGHVAA